MLLLIKDYYGDNYETQLKIDYDRPMTAGVAFSIGTIFCYSLKVPTNTIKIDGMKIGFRLEDERGIFIPERRIVMTIEYVPHEGYDANKCIADLKRQYALTN
jgi:hypothetical protein